MKKILGLILIVILVISFSGCQLAVDTDYFGDSTFVGVYVTTEMLYDTVYATYDENSAYPDKAYTFDTQIDGVAFYYTVNVDTETNTTAFVPVYSDKLFDTNISIAKNNSLEATLKFNPNDGTTVVYINRVYQDKDGTVYMVSGDSIACQDGTIFSYDMSLVNNEIYTTDYVDYSCSVKITLEKQEEIEKYVISQNGSYDETTSWIHASTYTSDDLPEKFVVYDENTEYLTFETYTIDGEVERDVLEEGTDYLIELAVLEDGIFYTKVNCELIWD